MRHLRRLCDPLILAVSLPTICLTLVLTTAYAFGDDGTAPPATPLAFADPTPDSPSAPTEPVSAAPDLANAIYEGVTTGNWFLAAGAVLVLVTMGVRSVLKKHWPALEEDLWGIALVAGLSGLGALGNAWLADVDLEARTAVGALKVWAAAVWLYVTGKRLLESRPKIPASSHISLLIVVIVIPLLAGCPGSGPGPGPVVADAVIDCIGERRAEIDALLLELTPLLAFDSPDWSAVYQRAKAAGKVVGGCALAELVQRYLGGRTAVPESESWRARDTLERFRTQEAGGATFRTAYGRL